MNRRHDLLFKFSHSVFDQGPHVISTKHVMNKFFRASFVICIFLALTSIQLGFVDLYFYYIFIVVGFPILLVKYRTIDKGFLSIIVVLTSIGLINVVLGNNDLASFVKIFLGVLVSFWYYFFIIRHNNFQLFELFELYYKYAVYTAYLGFFQFFSYLVGFTYGYDWSFLGCRVMRPTDFGGILLYPIHSLTGEPSAYAFLLSPAIYLAVARLMKKGIYVGSKWQAIVILASYILSQSSTGYFAIIIAVSLINLKHISLSRVGLVLITLPSLVLSLYVISPKFKDRIDSSFQLMTGEIIIDAAEGSDANGSSLVLFNHFLIAKKNASDHLFGTGLGSHHVAFEKYNTLRVWFTGYGAHGIVLNIHDASSLFNRILSEMGWPGILCVLIFILKFFIKEGDDTEILINHASLVAILTALLRNGHYFVFGLPFFIFCYYYSASLSKKLSKQTENHTM